MLSAFRSASKSTIGSIVMGLIMLAIVGGFAIGDLSNVGSGSLNFGSNSSTIAEVGGETITDREMSDAMQRRLQQVRQQDPNADYPSIIGDYDLLLNAMIDERALIAFANQHGFPLSKRMIDAEIAQIPQTRGLNGQFSDQAYQAFLAQQRLTDAQVRQLVAGQLLQRLILAPVAVNARAPVGLARPYASMLLEAREGKAVTIPVDLFRAGLNPTAQDLQTFYNANRARYTVPEQRVIRYARIDADRFANVSASDQEIAAYYNANRATYGGGDTRTLTQAVVPNQAVANQVAARAKGGADLAAATGASGAVTTLESQTREGYASIAGDQAAAAAFSASSGAVVGPFQSDFGWVVVKVSAVQSATGKSLAEAREEIAARLNADKRRQALEEAIDKLQTAVDDGSNFEEAAAELQLQTTTTPPIVANGRSLAQPDFRAPPELANSIQAAFQMAPNDPPEIVAMPEDRGYFLVTAQDVVPAAPAPLASIRDRVASDWTNRQAETRARQTAQAIAAKVGRGMPLADAVNQAGVDLPAIRPIAARRLEIASSSGVVAPPVRALFSLGEGKSKMVEDPQGRGFFVVKVDKIVPGNAQLQPGLISQMQTDLQQSLVADYTAQFLAAVRSALEVSRNEKAIAEQKQRLRSGT